MYLVAVGLVTAECWGAGDGGRGSGDEGGGVALAWELTDEVVLIRTVKVLPQSFRMSVGQAHTGVDLITCQR